MGNPITLRWPREPLVYFLVAGALLFLFSDLVDSSASDLRIELTNADINRLNDQWQAQMGRPPSSAELNGLTEQWIREEIFYREAMRLNLDQNDIIIRRRLVQKITFLTEDVATSKPASTDTLKSFYDNNLERYTLPDRFSFIHRYFSNERHDNAEDVARAALGDPEITGDPFMLQRSYAERSTREIGELFGRQFADSIQALPIGEWSGPVRSAYGWHLVQVQQFLLATPREFGEVATKVANDVRLERREKANKTFYEGLKERYEILTP